MMPRKFRARSMPAALQAVEKELGSEALIVSVRHFPDGPAWHVWRKTGVEVVAIPPAVASLHPEDASPDPEKGPVPLKEETEKRILYSGKAGSPEHLEMEYSNLQRNGDGSATKEPVRVESGLPRLLEIARERLQMQGVNKEIIERVLHSAGAELSPQAQMDPAMVRRYIRQQLQAGLHTDCGGCLAKNRVICLLGANGSGKTSAGAKIAAYAIKALGKRVRWITTDTLRAGAIAKAQAFTAPLGIPLQLAYNPEELSALAVPHAEEELVLVDTPGCNPFHKKDLHELELLLAGIPERHTLLVASATRKEADLQEELAIFSPFLIKGWVITMMDETHTYGDIYNLVVDSQLPVSFFTSGTTILDALHPAEGALLLDALLGENPSA